MSSNSYRQLMALHLLFRSSKAPVSQGWEQGQSRNWSWEPGTQSRFSTWVVELQSLESSWLPPLRACIIRILVRTQSCRVNPATPVWDVESCLVGQMLSLLVQFKTIPQGSINKEPCGLGERKSFEYCQK